MSDFTYSDPRAYIRDRKVYVIRDVFGDHPTQGHDKHHMLMHSEALHPDGNTLQVDRSVLFNWTRINEGALFKDIPYAFLLTLGRG